MVLGNFKKALYISLGITSVCLGVIGIFVPLMPTTVFLIIAAWFFFWADQSYLVRLKAHKNLGPLVNRIPSRFLPRHNLVKP